MMPNVINTHQQVSKHWLLQRCHLCHEYAITDDDAGQSSEKLCNQQSLMSNQHFYHWWELNHITLSQLLNFAYVCEITYFARTRLLFLVVLSSQDYPSLNPCSARLLLIGGLVVSNYTVIKSAATLLVGSIMQAATMWSLLSSLSRKKDSQ